MTDLLEQGSAWLEDQRHAHMTRTVTYTRTIGVLGTFVTLAATIGKTEFEQADDFGIVHRIQSRDYLVLATDLVLGGEQSLPKAGDKIQETVGSTMFLYEVMAPGGEPPWRYSDPYRKTLRIHTKLVGTEET